MTKLHTFGCSFTFGNGLFPKEPYNIQYRKNEDDIIWPEIVAKHFDYELVNRGEGLMSNDRIFDRIIENMDTISSDDVVILQMSYHHRFDIPNKEDNILLTIAPNAEPILRGIYTPSEIEKICFVSALWDSELYKKRNELRFNFIYHYIKDIIKVKKCILWDVSVTDSQYERIINATYGKINDHHWSYKGHKDFANHIINEING